VEKTLIRASGRPWWQARYRSGRVVSEWDTVLDPVRKLLPHRENWRSRWEEIPKAGLCGVRLLCPNGIAAELEAERDYSLFQLKVGGFALGRAGGSERWCDAQVIGLVLDGSGACRLRAWEVQGQRLVDVDDNVTFLQYRKIGPLGLDALGIRV
jgi:hypothetical protein